MNFNELLVLMAIIAIVGNGQSSDFEYLIILHNLTEYLGHLDWSY